MKDYRQALISLAVMFILALPVFAQSGSALRGQVVDELDAVIPGATVTLSSSTGSNPRTAVANANGEFTFQNVPPGTYTVSVQFKGFQPFVDTNVTVPLSTGPFKV